ncbi:hypothetical protein TNCV_1290521 [Trichonephila clavipes]|nr:hypothetical protein TNCV_1290521 [Trichonephila clavipes]
MTINARREFSGRLCGHTAKEVCGSSVMLVDSGVPDVSTMSLLLVGPAVPHLQRNLLNCKIKTLSPRETILVMKPIFFKEKTWPYVTSVIDSKHQPSTPITSHNLK